MQAQPVSKQRVVCVSFNPSQKELSRLGKLGRVEPISESVLEDYDSERPDVILVDCRKEQDVRLLHRLKTKNHSLELHAIHSEAKRQAHWCYDIPDGMYKTIQGRSELTKALNRGYLESRKDVEDFFNGVALIYMAKSRFKVAWSSLKYLFSCGKKR